MKRIAVDPAAPHEEAILRALAVLGRGKVVAFPTETVYGLAVRADLPSARERLQKLKGRAATKAIAYLLGDINQKDALVARWPNVAQRLADAFWPGPLTLVVPGNDGGMVGLRLPDLALPRALAQRSDGPLLQTSANLSGQPAALNPAAVAGALPRLNLLLDGGRAPGGKSSTVVRCTDDHFTILRAGAIPPIAIARAASRLTLFACTGNICRSPLAEYLYRARLAGRLGCEPKDLVRFGHRIASFGIMARQGNTVPKLTLTVGRNFDLDLATHRARPFSIELLKMAERVYVADQTHIDFLLPYFQDRPDALQLLDPDEKSVPDPYGRTIKAYKKSAEMIEKAVEQRLDELFGEGPKDPSDKPERGS